MNIFITGKPGCGKSTLIKGIIDSLKNKKIAGIITPEIRKGKERYGFKIIDLASNKEEILASINIKSKYKVSKYGVSIEGIDKTIDIFLKSYGNADFVFIDELGKMEFYSEKFKELINKIMNNNKINIMTIGLRLINRFKNIEVFYLEKDNFDIIKTMILEKIKKPE